MRCLTPSRMSAPDRVAELGELLAAGVQRIAAKNIKSHSFPNSASNSQEQLDAVAAVEAPCRTPIEVPA